MKKLTIEEKAKAYDEALSRAESLYDNESSSADTLIACEAIFPELQESNDEKIRKALINIFSTHKDYEIFFGISVENIVTWLEKQKNTDVLDKEEREFADNVDLYRKDMDEFYKKGYNAGREAEKQYWIEKQVSIDKEKMLIGARKDVASSIIS